MRHMYDGTLTVKEVAERVGRSVSWVWDKVRNDPAFPKPAWRRPMDTKFWEAEVDAYIRLRRGEVLPEAHAATAV